MFTLNRAEAIYEMLQRQAWLNKADCENIQTSIQPEETDNTFKHILMKYKIQMK